MWLGPPSMNRKMTLLALTGWCGWGCGSGGASRGPSRRRRRDGPEAGAGIQQHVAAGQVPGEFIVHPSIAGSKRCFRSLASSQRYVAVHREPGVVPALTMSSVDVQEFVASSAARGRNRRGRALLAGVAGLQELNRPHFASAGRGRGRRPGDRRWRSRCRACGRGAFAEPLGEAPWPAASIQGPLIINSDCVGVVVTLRMGVAARAVGHVEHVEQRVAAVADAPSDRSARRAVLPLSPPGRPCRNRARR